MKKLFLVLCLFIFTAGVCAAEEVALYPRIDGNDVLVPDRLIKAIPGFSADKPVYAATDINGWFVRGEEWATEEAKKDTLMIKQGDFWRARGLKGERFHPVQLNGNGEPKWAKIEKVYPLWNSKGVTKAFIDLSEGSPCLLVK